MDGLIDHRSSSLYCLLNNIPDVDLFQIKLNPVAEKTRDFEKIIHQHHQIINLTPNNAGRLDLSWVLILLPFKNVDSIGNCSQWIADFVRERCQEFILATVQGG